MSAADHGHENDQPAEVVARGRDQRGAAALEEEEIGEDSDQSQQRQRDERAEDADTDGEQRDRHNGTVVVKSPRLRCRAACAQATRNGCSKSHLGLRPSAPATLVRCVS